MVAGALSAHQQQCVQELEGVKLVALPNARRIVGQRYLLEITWCGNQLQWQVFTDSPDPGAAPDFVFSDEFHPLHSKLQCETQNELRKLLMAWDSQQAQYAALSVRLLLQLYNTYQKERIDRLADTRLQFEISTLPDSWDVQYFYLQPQNGDAAKVCLSLALTLDQRRLLSLFPAAPSRQAPFRLVFVFRINTASGYTPQVTLQVPTFLASTLPAFALPAWSSRSCIIEFVDEAEQSIQQQLEQHLDAAQLWQEFFRQVAQILGQPLEINTQRPAAMFCFLYQATQLLLHVEIPVKFPAEPPTILIQSVMHSSSKEGSFPLKRYPWSPRWTPADMAARVVNHLKEEVQYWVQRLTG